MLVSLLCINKLIIGNTLTQREKTVKRKIKTGAPVAMILNVLQHNYENMLSAKSLGHFWF